MASYFISFLLFQAAHQSLNGKRRISGRVAHSGGFQKSLSSIAESIRSAVCSPNLEAPSATRHSEALGDCPICLESLRGKKYFQSFLNPEFEVRRWPGCGHGYHRRCYKQMLHHETPCAICKAPHPSFTSERTNYLESLRRAPPETHENSGTRSDNNDQELSRAISLSLQHEAHRRSNHAGSAACGSEGYNDDEALALGVSLSLQNEVNHHAHHMAGTSSGAAYRTNDEELALAISLSLQHDAPHRSENFGRSSSGVVYYDDDEELAKGVSLSLQHEAHHQSDVGRNASGVVYYDDHQELAEAALLSLQHGNHHHCYHFGRDSIGAGYYLDDKELYQPGE
ncbi:hypothetical protein PCANC_20089 [Puccinia coronata f. sp. avenae]|uniref:RING-type domain-containing protein n=1 Tax=Puccinia coronata f. sp. avenae TaxID=200324 RepID=A0A2N5TR35_9BASI|nr:hypothetical protein PCANC_20089 [Puccinia coronata f. sp. avenae]PLW42017.1 hypothetical protein PCASD_10068 [Puccinia coronata f. sp. avenae]